MVRMGSGLLIEGQYLLQGSRRAERKPFQRRLIHRVNLVKTYAGIQEGGNGYFIGRVQ
jgi:hypothetical protein